MITLYDYWRSSASYRLRITLGLAGLNWDSVIVDLLKGDHKAKPHLARNPQGLVPALEIDDGTLTQSLAIIEYLDETRSLNLIPKDPLSRARVRALSYAIAMEIHPVCNLGVAKYAVENSNGGIQTQQWMQHFITNGLQSYEHMMSQGLYSFGDEVTMADICLIPQIYNAKRWGVDLDPLPKIRETVARLEALPAFAAAHPDQTPH